MTFLISYVNINVIVGEKFINPQSKTTYILNLIHLVLNGICFQLQFIFLVRNIGLRIYNKLSTETLLSIETKHSGIYSIKLNSQNAPQKLPDHKKLVSFVSGVYQCSIEYYLLYFH